MPVSADNTRWFFSHYLNGLKQAILLSGNHDWIFATCDSYIWCHEYREHAWIKCNKEVGHWNCYLFFKGWFVETLRNCFELWLYGEKLNRLRGVFFCQALRGKKGGVWRQVTMVATSLHFNSLFGQSQTFALSKDRRNVWSTNLTLSAIMHRKVIINVTFSFKRSRNFATMEFLAFWLVHSISKLP